MVYAITSFVHGYHAYQDILGAEIDSKLPSSPKPDNRDEIFQWNILHCTDELLLDYHKNMYLAIYACCIPVTFT